MNALSNQSIGVTPLSASIALAIAFAGGSAEQAATKPAPSSSPTSEASQPTEAPAVSVAFFGQAAQDVGYFIQVSPAGDPYPLYMTMTDDAGDWAATSTTGSSHTFTFETPAIPDPSGWGVFDTPDTYTATIVPMDDVDGGALSGVTSVASVAGPGGGIVGTGGTSVSWTVG